MVRLQATMTHIHDVPKTASNDWLSGRLDHGRKMMKKKQNSLHFYRDILLWTMERQEAMYAT